MKEVKEEESTDDEDIDARLNEVKEEELTDDEDVNTRSKERKTGKMKISPLMLSAVWEEERGDFDWGKQRPRQGAGSRERRGRGSKIEDKNLATYTLE